MHLIRRSAFRAINSPASSFLSKSRSITTTSPFTSRVKPQVTFSHIFRRLASNDTGSEGGKSETESAPSSADSEDQSSIASAISSASESASSYASDAASSLTHNATEAKDRLVDGVSSAASAVSDSFTPKQQSNKGYGNDNEVDERSGPPEHGYGGYRQRDFAAVEAPPLPPSKSIYVGNLLFEANEDDLSREFGEFGKIEEVKIAKDPRNLSKGFGYITFDSIDAATAAIQAKHQNVMEGRRLVVNYQIASKRPSTINPPSHTLFIGNLAFEMSDADLNKLFQDVKNVLDVRVAIDRRTGQPRGFAHADFVDVESAKKGLEYLQGKQFYGRALRVDYAGSISRDRSRTGSILGTS